MSIGSRIIEARKRLGMTQTELAKQLGVSQGSVANYENEFNTPKVEMMYKLFDVLQVDANFLYQDDMAIREEKIFLSQEEKRLVSAYRSAERRYKEIALEMLEEHPEKDLSRSAL